MFDFAWSELGLVALLAVLILGPKELPQAMRTIAKVVRKVRGLASEFQGHFNDMVREAELDDVRKSVQKLSSTSVSAEVNKMIDPEGEIGKAFTDDPLKDKNEPSANPELSSEDSETPKAVASDTEASKDGETTTDSGAEPARGAT